MNVITTPIPGLLIIEPKVIGDARGFFFEAFSDVRYLEAGIREGFVQDNVSFSRKGVLRGLHMQNPNPQGKLVSVIQGEIWDVGVDLRLGSPTYKQWFGVTLSELNHRQFYLPPGIAHGFLVTGESALVTYKATDYYNPSGDFSVRWNDAEIGVEWPLKCEPTLSEKDKGAPPLATVSNDRLVRFVA